MVAVVFIYAGLVKIINPAAFAEQVDNYRLLPYFMVTLVAVILPWLELFCGLLLLFGRWLPGATMVLMLLNVIFLIAIISVLARGLDISCGCFSTGDEGARIGTQKLIEDLLLLAANLAIYFRVISTKKKSG